MVTVDTAGRIWLNDREYTQLEAIETARALTQAVQDSIYRTQVDTPRYRSSEGILERQNSPLGRAISALGKIYS